ncbi:hypothetical protein DFAR_1480006 [Desulfarculales bacterium]
MLKRNNIANQVLSSVAYYPKWPTSHGMDGPLAVESVARLKRDPQTLRNC